MLYALIRVQMVQNRISVALIPSSKDNNIEMLANVLDDLLSIRPDMHIPIDDLPLHRLEWHLELIPLNHGLIGVNERLIHIKDHSFAI